GAEARDLLNGSARIAANILRSPGALDRLRASAANYITVTDCNAAHTTAVVRCRRPARHIWNQFGNVAGPVGLNHVEVFRAHNCRSFSIHRPRHRAGNSRRRVAAGVRNVPGSGLRATAATADYAPIHTT